MTARVPLSPKCRRVFFEILVNDRAPSGLEMLDEAPEAVQATFYDRLERSIAAAIDRGLIWAAASVATAARERVCE